jgi:hypothetical protein
VAWPVSGHAANAFEVPHYTRNKAYLEQENTRLKTRVGELLLELKKNDELLG